MILPPYEKRYRMRLCAVILYSAISSP